MLAKAAEKGTVDTKWTNVSIGGASGAGKTSFLCLLLNKPAPESHHSTPVVQPLPMCVVEEQEESTTSTSSSTNSSDDETADHMQPAEVDDNGYTTTESSNEGEPVPGDSSTGGADGTTKPYEEHTDAMESYLVMAGKKHQWRTVEREDLHRKLAECIRSLDLDALDDEAKEMLTKRETSSLSKPTSSSNSVVSFRSTTVESTAVELPTSTQPMVPMRIQPKACLARSEGARKVLELLAVVKQCIELDQTHFIHLLDTGGQARFMDIAPALMCYNSINIFVHKLNQKLDDFAEFFYSVDGKRIGEECREVTNKELLSSLITARRDIRRPEVRGLSTSISKPYLLIIGTHYDQYKILKKEGKLEETVTEKNMRLLKELGVDKEVRYDYKPSKCQRGKPVTEPQVIFPLDATSRHE